MQQTSIRIREIAFTGYPVKDLPRARRFYESVLHLTPSMIDEAGQWVEYDVDGAAFFIGRFEEWEPATSGPSVAFEVEDLEQTLQILREEKVAIFMEPFETPGCWMAVVGDSEGNSLMVHKRKP